MNSLMLWVAAAFAGGILLARAASPNLPVTLVLAGLALLFGAVLTRRGRPWPALGFSLAGFMAAGAVAWLLFPFRFPSDHIARLVERGIVDEAEPVRLEGWITSQPLLRAPSVRFDLQVTAAEGSGYSTSAQGKVRLWVSLNPGVERDDVPNPLELRYGDAIRAWVVLRRPRNFHNPGSFDHRRRLEQIDDLYLTASLRRGHHIEKVGSGKGNRWLSAAFLVRRKLLDGIDRLYAPWSAEGRWGAMLKALLLGDRTSLDRRTVEGFRKSGLYHLLVISGLHLGLLALIGHGLLKIFRLSEACRIPVVLGFLSLYCLVIDLRAPTLRALLMISVYLVGRLLLRQHSLLNAIGISSLAADACSSVLAVRDRLSALLCRRPADRRGGVATAPRIDRTLPAGAGSGGGRRAGRKARAESRADAARPPRHNRMAGNAHEPAGVRSAGGSEYRSVAVARGLLGRQHSHLHRHPPDRIASSHGAIVPPGQPGRNRTQCGGNAGAGPGPGAGAPLFLSVDSLAGGR